ncbi:ABC transporter transmembrane domain-containing protein [Desulfosarcina cetonica]|uniref:ABC transporter transmembrane domain-containing protein n=1 Tax=Desulfosarcina cetonica TaxID=90730 RepID=UPI001FED3E93|nr:ABC transporter transmembrane domain-containing protein [Desulfosarcina cetonica]
MVLVAMDVRLALLSFLVLPLVGLTAFVFSSQVRDVFRELRNKVAEINTRFSETIGGIKVIQTFRRTPDNAAAFARLNHANYLAGMRQINIFAVFMPVIEMLGVTAIAIVIYVGGSHVIGQTMSIGVLAAFLAICACSSGPSVIWRKNTTSCKTPWPRPNAFFYFSTGLRPPPCKAVARRLRARWKPSASRMSAWPTRPTSRSSNRST